MIDANGNVVGTVNADGSIVDLDGNVIETATEKIVVGADGKTDGQSRRKQGSTTPTANVIATVDADGTVRDLDGNVIDASVEEVPLIEARARADRKKTANDGHP